MKMIGAARAVAVGWSSSERWALSERWASLARFATGAALLAVAVGCGGSSGDSGEFTPGANNDAECPQTEDELDSGTIPEGSNCSYTNVVTAGDILVEDGASLTLEAGEVGGNVQASSDAAVVVRATTIQGDLQMSGGSSFEVSDSVVEGNLQIVGVDGPVSIVDTEVVGDVQIAECAGETVELEATSIGGNLDCTENDSTFSFESVTVDGSATEQCSDAES